MYIGCQFSCSSTSTNLCLTKLLPHFCPISSTFIWFWNFPIHPSVTSQKSCLNKLRAPWSNRCVRTESPSSSFIRKTLLFHMDSRLLVVSGEGDSWHGHNKEYINRMDALWLIRRKKQGVPLFEKLRLFFLRRYIFSVNYFSPFTWASVFRNAVSHCQSWTNIFFHLKRVKL